MRHQEKVLHRIEIDGKFPPSQPFSISLSSSSIETIRPNSRQHLLYQPENKFNLHEALKSFPTSRKQTPSQSSRIFSDESVLEHDSLAGPGTPKYTDDENSLFQIQNDDSVKKYLNDIMKDAPEGNRKTGIKDFLNDSVINSVDKVISLSALSFLLYSSVRLMVNQIIV